MKTKASAKTSFWKQHYLFFVFVVIALAAVLRFWELGSNPAALNRDEAALAYNAFLLQQTGMDEWQQPWPLALRSFGDYKLLGYSASIIPFFYMFGWHDWVVRLPAALAGVGIVIISIAIARWSWNWPRSWSVMLGVFIAVQPVFIFFSRMAWEANVALFFLLLSCWFFWRGIKKPSLIFDAIGLIIFVIASFTYNTPVFMIPILCVLLIWSRGIKKPQHWLFPVVGLCALGAANVWLLHSVIAQKNSVTVFADEHLWSQWSEYRTGLPSWQQRILGNRWLFYAEQIAIRFYKSFSPEFLVIKGGQHPWHAIPSHAHLLLATYLLSFTGMLSSISEWRKKIFTFSWPKGLLVLTLFSLWPAIITVDAPHATRSLLFLWCLVVWSTIGLQQLWHWQWPATISKIIVPIIVIFVSVGAVNYLRDYFISYRAQSSVILEAGLKETLADVQQKYGDQPIAIIDPGGYLYIQVAWVKLLQPQEFFRTMERHLPDTIGFQYGYRLGNYRFVKEATDRLKDEKVWITWLPAEGHWQSYYVNSDVGEK